MALRSLTSNRLPELWYPRFWTSWLAASAVAFAVVETNALTTHPRTPRDSLSSNLQWWLCRRPATFWASALVWVGFSAWFLDHIWLSTRRKVAARVE